MQFVLPGFIHLRSQQRLRRGDGPIVSALCCAELNVLEQHDPPVITVTSQCLSSYDVHFPCSHPLSICNITLPYLSGLHSMHLPNCDECMYSLSTASHAGPGPGPNSRAGPAGGRSVQRLWQALWNTHLLCVWRSLKGTSDQRAGERWGGAM